MWWSSPASVGHSMIVLGELDAANARQVDRLLTDADMFDAMAGHVVHAPGPGFSWGWPALSADPSRLRRIDPGIEIDLL
jgi:hypothetical protein